MAVKRRREREKENLRQEILDAAREMFAEEGYKNVSMRKIAEKIEYSPTTIYLYFKDKTDLLSQICDETFAGLARHLEEILLPNAEPLENLRIGLRAYIEFGLKHPNHYEVTFMTPIMGYLSQEDHPFEGSMGQRAFELMHKNVSVCMEAGKLKGDMETISQTLWAGIHGVTSLLIAHTDFPFIEKDKLIDSVIDTMIAGLKT
jgi:AcrR family transcriptional regulator